MTTSGSISVTSHRSRYNSVAETVDEIESSEPSSGYCSADDEHLSHHLRNPTVTGSRYDRRLSESSSSSGGISSKSLLSLSLSKALSLTLCESPPPSPPLDEVLMDQASPDFRSPASSVDYESSFWSAVHAPPVDELPHIVSSQPVVYTLPGRVEPSTNTSSNFEKRGGFEIGTTTTVANLRLASQEIRTDLHLTEAKSIQELSDCSESHQTSRSQHTTCQENDDLSYTADSQTTGRSNSLSCSGPVGENAIADKKREEQRGLSEALLSLQFGGSAFEKHVVDHDEVYFVTADGSLKKLLPLADTLPLSSSIKQKPVSRLPQSLPAVPRNEPKKSFDTLFPEHSTGFGVKADLRWCNSDIFSPKLCATDGHQSPRFAVDTGSTGSMASVGSMSSTVSTVSTGYKDPIQLTDSTAAVEFFHSYAAVIKPTDSCHSTAPSNRQLQDLSCHDAHKDLSHDSVVHANLPEATTAFLAHRQDLSEGWVSILTTNAAGEVQQKKVEDKEVCDESPKSGSGSSPVDSSLVQKSAPKRSRSSHRKNPKRRFRPSNPALVELEDHGYSLGATCRPPSPHHPNARPCPTVEEEMASTAKVSSVLAKLLLTRERLFPNEGSDGFIARSGNPEPENSERLVQMNCQRVSGTLLEKLLTGEVDQEEIKRSEERIIRDRMQSRVDDKDDDDIDLQLQDFDPDILELENLEELWNNYGGLEIFSRDLEELMRIEEETSFHF